MSIWTLVTREIRHRTGNFVLGVLAVAVAVGSLIAAELLLTRDQALTEIILSGKQREVEKAIAEREEEVQQAGKELEDAIRKQMVKLGFNVLIVPESQDLSELHLNGTLSETIPENYVDKLAESSIITVNHLLPTVTKRIDWPEKEIDVILVGTRGEVPILHRGLKKPILDAVAPGEMVVGSSIHQKLDLKRGDTVTLNGVQFTVTTLHPERGSTDDVTVWIDLAAAQKMLGMENLIHAILALECECAGDRISVIRKEIQGILPGTQVVERQSRALARAEARAQAKTTAETALERAKADGKQTLEREQSSRKEIENRHADLAGTIVPMVVLASALWVGLLTLLNVRQRRNEIGILRAIGVSSSKVLAVFLSKAALIGLSGGLLGLLFAYIGFQLAGSEAPKVEGLLIDRTMANSTTQTTMLLAVLLAPVLSCVAGWLPSLAASRQDPAVVLQND